MKKNTVFIQALALLFCGFLLSCDKTNLEGSLYIPAGGWELSFPEDESPGAEVAQCPGPRPPRQGCSQICKPCFFFVCKNGEWTRTPIKWPEGLCNRRPIPGSPTNVCQRTPTGYCPPACHVCI